MIYAELSNDVAFYDAIISTVRGSAVHLSESPATLVDVVINNASAEGDGGALLLEAGPAVELTRCTFANSSAANGAVGSLSPSTVHSEQSQFESNAAAGSAGVVFSLVDTCL